MLFDKQPQQRSTQTYPPLHISLSRTSETLLSALWPDEKDWPFTIDSFLEQRNMNLDGEFAKVKPMPGAIRLVKHLADSGVPICVSPLRYVPRRLKDLTEMSSFDTCDSPGRDWQQD